MAYIILTHAAFLAVAGAAAPSPGGLTRLRGGSASPALLSPERRRLIDDVLRETERSAATLRQRLRPLGGPTPADAAAAGAALGFCFGKVLIGDPKLLALVGAASFAYAQRHPGSTCRLLGAEWGSRLKAVSGRSAQVVWDVRGSLGNMR
mmetsp:Transcript_243/g.759  ORF Transcript_243/g.759 Transcript_243/m.759 type:complete len:150 (+) Transcript_243:31-480(+)